MCPYTHCKPWWPSITFIRCPDALSIVTLPLFCFTVPPLNMDGEAGEEDQDGQTVVEQHHSDLGLTCHCLLVSVVRTWDLHWKKSRLLLVHWSPVNCSTDNRSTHLLVQILAVPYGGNCSAVSTKYKSRLFVQFLVDKTVEQLCGHLCKSRATS